MPGPALLWRAGELAEAPPAQLPPLRPDHDRAVALAVDLDRLHHHLDPSPLSQRERVGVRVSFSSLTGRDRGRSDNQTPPLPRCGGRGATSYPVPPLLRRGEGGRGW